MKSIYLDYAATTPIDSEVQKAMEPYFSDGFGNPSAIHSFGRTAQAALDNARDDCAKFLNTNTSNIIFTSGATESNNLAILGLIKKLDKKSGHIITTSIEHPSVLEVIKNLEKQGFEVDYIKPETDGVININKIKSAIKDDTFLISIMYVNNEIGTIQPIKELGELISNINNEKENKIYFHTDAVQAAPYLKLDAKELAIDFLSISGHKIYGPKGVGLLYLKNSESISSIFSGGKQENGSRPGTQNMSGAIGLASALELVNSEKYKIKLKEIKEIRNDLWEKLNSNIKGLELNGSLENRIPSNLNFSFENINSENLLIKLDQEGVAASYGSACAAGALEKSYVLGSLGGSGDRVLNSIRLSFGKYSKIKDNGKILEVFQKI